MLSELVTLDSPYETRILDDADLAAAEIFAREPSSGKLLAARAGEALVEGVLNHPADTAGRRAVARATFRETVEFDTDRPSWRLARPLPTIVAATLDEAPIDPTMLKVHTASSMLRLDGRAWPRAGRLAVTYEAGWRTALQGAGTGPALPADIKRACLRAAALALSDLTRLDPGVRSRREADADVGSIEETFAAPPATAGIDDEIARLLAPWRWVAVF